ncbi:hypothetical protein [Salinirarus marinus]|uniref:hypothetical protein n=1 Tax=Salinirarus marinus TaxID=3068310 RepID=UPI003C6C01CE
MHPRRKSSLLWGAAGTLTVLVAAQGYQLLVGSLGLDPVALVALAAVVGVVVAGVTYAVEHRLHPKGRT